ncbi:MAG: MiaE family protein [Planctomycetota bacterium]|jgi:tRNA-(ms[2]io[6]A)-hydroxylase
MTTRELSVDQLPLRSTTPPAWASSVLATPLPLLNDHAWLEKKAASNALELLNRWPEPCPPENWVKQMTAIARDEIEHLGIVVRLLARRGGRLTKHHQSRYASDLRKLVRQGSGRPELMDRLMVSALIEARSCERFAVLARHCDDKELGKLYQGLYASEAGHYEVFINLARELPEGRAIAEDDVGPRWDEMLDAEASIIARQPTGPGIHSGCP